MLGESGILYKSNGISGYTPIQANGSILSGIRELYKIGRTYLLVGNSGQLMHYSETALSEVNFVKDGKTVVNRVMTSNSVDTYLDTDIGYFKYTGSGYTAQYEQLGFNPVTYDKYITTDIFISDMGELVYKGNNEGNIAGNVPASPDSYEKYTLPWMNNNPIVKDNILFNINMPANSILDRVTELDIEFSMVTESKAKAFNIYYGKTYDIGDRNKWNEIENNIEESSLTSKEYDTG